MRLTIAKTLFLDEVPEEIDENYATIEDRMIGVRQMIKDASENAREGRYIDSVELLEKTRQALSMLDQNLEELQSLSISYDQVRLAQHMPPQQNTGAMEGDE